MEEKIAYKYNNERDADLKRILNPKHTALLMIDMQNDFCSEEGKFSKAGRDCTSIRRIVPSCKNLLQGARHAGVFIVHIQQSTLSDNKSDSGGWLAFKTRDGKSPDYALLETWGWKHIDELAPVCQKEPVVMKFRPDAFLYTQLDMLLRANSIQTVVCCGCNTEGCVLATVMGSAFHDYYTCVAEDAVASSVAEAHEHAIWLMKKRYIVRDSTKILACWK